MPFYRLIIFTLLIYSSAYWGGCSPAPKTTVAQDSLDPAENDTYIESSIGDASYLNPILATDTASSSINGLVFNGLVKYDETLKITGDLAESWEVGEGGLTLTFHLKRNILWHDGTPFTAEDVLYTYLRLRDPEVKTPYSSNYEKVKEVKVLNPHTFKVVYNERFVPALESWGMGIVPKHVFGGATGKNFNEHPANKRPIGTGPYRFKEWKPDEKIVLESNPRYFNGKPKIARYVFRIIPDSAVEFLELRNKSIDSMSLTPDQYFAYPEFFESYDKYKFPSAVYTYLGFNLKNPLFADRRARQAIAHAINKEELVGGVLLGMGQSASGPFLPLSWAYNPEVKDFAYDLDQSRALLKAAGWKDSDQDGWLDKDHKPFAFTIITNQGNKTRALCAEIIQQQLKKIGIKIDIRVIEWSTFIKDFINNRNYDATILGWALSPDPDQYGIWHSSQMKNGQYNFVGYSNPIVDKMLEQGRQEFDFNKRKELHRAMHKIIHEDAPYIFLFYPDSLPVIHKRFRGIKVAAISSFGFGWNFEKWYVPKKWVRYPVMAQ